MPLCAVSCAQARARLLHWFWRIICRWSSRGERSSRHRHRVNVLESLQPVSVGDEVVVPLRIFCDNCQMRGSRRRETPSQPLEDVPGAVALGPTWAHEPQRRRNTRCVFAAAAAPGHASRPSHLMAGVALSHHRAETRLDAEGSDRGGRRCPEAALSTLKYPCPQNPHVVGPDSTVRRMGRRRCAGTFLPDSANNLRALPQHPSCRRCHAL